MSTGPIENRRRYTRQSVVQEARLRMAGGVLLPCEIRDFCFGGVFLKSLGGDAGLDHPDARTGCHVSILFKPNPNAADFELTGRIAHISNQGFGVAFLQQPPAGAIMALRKRAASPEPTAPSGAADRAEVDIDALSRICRQALEAQLSPVLEDFFREVDSALRHAADSAHSMAERAIYSEAMTLLKTHRADIERGFSRHVLRQAQGFVAAPHEGPGFGCGGSGLSLVDNTEFEDWLNLNAAIAKVENLHGDHLQQIERRFSWLAQREVNRQNNPYGPGVIEHAFRAALHDLPLQNAAKQLIYGVFGHVLDPRLTSLYRRIDEVTSHLVPSDFGHIVRPRKSAEAPSPRAVPSPEAPARLPAPKPTPYGAAATLLSLCSQQRGAGQGAAGEEGATQNVAPIITALRRLQARKAAQHVGYLQTPTLEAEVLQELSSSGAKALAPDHRQTIEILGALLDHLVNQDVVAPGVKPYVQELQIPLLEAALADPGLIHGESHPARDVINLLDHLALATNASGEIENPELRQAVTAISARIIREAVDNPGVFSEARAQLEQLTAPLLKARSARLARLQESCEAERRLESARRVVAEAIGGRVGGRSVPSVLLQLLDAGWRQLLILTVLREGGNTPPWDARIAVLDRLLLWLTPDGATFPLLEAHRLIAQVDEELQTVCPEPLTLNRITLELTALLIGRSDTGERKAPEFVTVPAETPGRREDEMEQGMARARLASFRVGDWLDFALDSVGHAPLRLSWIGEHPDRYVFADDKGRKALELSAQQFVRYLDEGRATFAEDRELPLLERSTGRLVQSMQEKLRFQATHDAVTGLINRREFVRQLQQRFDAPSPSFHLLCMIDLPQLRVINNLCGMEAGDRLLKEICVILRARFPGDHLLARLGDSSFGLLFGAEARDESPQKAGEILQAISDHHFRWGEHSFALAANLGMATVTGRGEGAEALLKNADAACMAARQKGPNCVQIYAADDVSLEAQKQMMDWVGRIDTLLAQDRLFVRCQMIAPIFPERDSHSHYEILLGIRDEHGDVVPPYDFVVAAERWNRASDIDRWQIQSVFRWVKEHRGRFAQIGGFSINLSGQSLNSASFLEFLHAQLVKGDLPTEKITFEITETAAIAEFGHAGHFIRQIKRHGCRFSLDDFGSGFSSYAYLKNLQADYLKIDGSFVRDLASSTTDYALVKSMNEIGHSLGMKTIAEYVENDAIMTKLREIGVDYAQGYLMGKPAPITALV